MSPQGLPEAANYKDTGCEFSPSCLACPLPECKYDSGLTQKQLEMSERRGRIMQLYGRGYSVDAIAQVVGVSARRVWHHIREARQ